jgi:hypothetical protein
MPTILRISGWRLYFYSNEGEEPEHIHARKGDMECKYRLLRQEFDIQEVWSYALSNAGRREIRKIMFDNFEFILLQWDEYFNYF